MIALEDFKNLKIGDRVLSRGWCYGTLVEDPYEFGGTWYAAILFDIDKDTPGKTFTVTHNDLVEEGSDD